MNTSRNKTRDYANKISEIEDLINTERLWIDIALSILDNENENFFTQLVLILNSMSKNNQNLYNQYEKLLELTNF